MSGRDPAARAADLAAVSAAQAMRDLYPRMFEPPFLEPDIPNPRHLEQATYLALARAAALRGGAALGMLAREAEQDWPPRSPKRWSGP